MNFLTSAWNWITEKAIWSWTNRVVVFGLLLEIADAYFRLLPPETQGTPRMIFFGVLVAVARARTL